MHKKCIVLIGTLDTKGEEIGYLKNSSLTRTPTPCHGHRRRRKGKTGGRYSRCRSSPGSSTEIEKLWHSRERQNVTEIMIKGAVVKLALLCRTGEVRE